MNCLHKIKRKYFKWSAVESNVQRKSATIYVTSHSTLQTPRQFSNYNFVYNWYVLYANLLPHPTQQNDRNINCTMSEDNNQQNGNSATNGDVPEIELIIKVKNLICYSNKKSYWIHFIISNSNKKFKIKTTNWNFSQQFRYNSQVLLGWFTRKQTYCNDQSFIGSPKFVVFSSLSLVR